MIDILCRFLQPLWDSGLNPTFFGTDKEPSEISTVRQIWPSATINYAIGMRNERSEPGWALLVGMFSMYEKGISDHPPDRQGPARAMFNPETGSILG